jgi:hypothetical protein
VLIYNIKMIGGSMTCDNQCFEFLASLL